MEAPIFVTGAHRSGTTWVGQMLGASGEAAYVHEPFNPIIEPGWVASPLPHWYLYVTAENAAEYRHRVEPAFRLRFPVRGRGRSLLRPRSLAVTAARAMTSASDRLRGRRALVKDPLALFSTEWIVEEFGAVPVVMVRHPAAFASSLLRLGWRFDFHNWLDQRALLADHLGAFEPEMRRFAAAPDAVDLIDEAALMWRAIYSTVAEFQRRHPEWIIVRHEDLAADAVASFGALYPRLGLTWNARASDTVVRLTSGADAEAKPGAIAPAARDSAAIGRLWTSRLPAHDVARLKDAVADVAPVFYTEDDWV